VVGEGAEEQAVVQSPQKSLGHRAGLTTTRRFTASHLHDVARRLFVAAGTPVHIAETVAEILVNANLAGHDSHGVLRIPAYLRRIAEGQLAPAAEPERVRETAGMLLVDGHKGFGHYATRQAMAWAIEKARQTDVCCVSLIRHGHIGRLGEYAEQAARAGCISLVTTGAARPDGELVVPFGGLTGVLSTNPIAVGVPTGDDVPFIMDFATSVVAEGKVQVARSRGAPLPEGWILDKAGRASIQPEDLYDGGHLLPFGQHKGYGLGVLVSLLGGLGGEFDAGRQTMEGTFLQAINVEAFAPLATYRRAVRATLDGIKRAAPAPGVSEVLVAGDPEARARAARLAEGIEVPEASYRQIREWAQRLQVAL
jgi:LDH2 family malate/lactate/ureidoglycolate dehydrogenase